jgi:iron only hydrogenase large subunit-like protein
MGDDNPARQVVFTNKAQCRDCYRCVRVCPVKAIRMHGGQAAVVEERCIDCGTCVRECPQHAKSFRDDVDRTVRLLASGVRVAASVAPSFAAVYPEWQQRRLTSALRRLGFCYVGETAIGAYQVARETAAIVAAQPNRALICTACPAVVRFVERYRPELVANLVPVVSPMLAHARHIRRRLGDDVRVVFIGPCVAKKAEADRPEFAGLVDCALTFAELAQWFQREGIDLAEGEESDFDEIPAGPSRLFPLVGGCVRTAGWSTDLLAGEVRVASGFSEVCTALDALGEESVPHVLEPLFCVQGCINGPAMPDARNLFNRRGDVLRYAAAAPGPSPAECRRPELSTRFTSRAANEPAVSEEQIRAALEMTGKVRDEDQLNCGACGYANCRDKAVAVIRGLAEPEMCIPHMKRLAEQRADRIVDTSPNGIVILDEHLKILRMNSAFRKFFMCSDALYGQSISNLLDPEPFERLASGQDQLIETTVEHRRYNLVCHQVMYPLREERQFVGIFVNVTHSRNNEEKLDHLRTQTILQAQELLEHQLQMAENIARFLGESTAKGEDLVEKLMVLAEEEGDTSQRKKGQWLRDMYTSK